MSRILEYLVWPWYSTWAIPERQACTPKISSRVARCDESYTCFLLDWYQFMDQCLRQVVVSWLHRFNNNFDSSRAETSCSPWAILRGTERPVNALHACFIWMCSLSIFFLRLRQLWSRAERVKGRGSLQFYCHDFSGRTLTLNMNIPLSLLWSTWSRALLWPSCMSLY